MTTTVKETVYGYGPHGSLIEPFGSFMAALTEAERKIPPEFKASARVEIMATGGGYDESPEIEIEIYYCRPKTEEDRRRERAEHDAWLAKNRAETERRERAAYALLKAKYGA